MFAFKCYVLIGRGFKSIILQLILKQNGEDNLDLKLSLQKE